MSPIRGLDTGMLCCWLGKAARTVDCKGPVLVEAASLGLNVKVYPCMPNAWIGPRLLKDIGRVLDPADALCSLTSFVGTPAS